ncbi:nucleotidyltransferase [Candidatus Roizmanbacteria bacterium RIFCSPLOWO2_01_FULL_38_12]|uniref:Nucleotidyltransferase n=1 Tax=Candidatus Roizmanbacteria bacterium RIFCSPLOWO2_01_FULL_38_12 TaxID=1802061 RepID=A0A1F7IY45_9BACT|nr:MAG: nucleotidyltransferase [Candidatus Roizmanbacteria bacterium RIFCSPHIGHO2_01_FULL_38_15]OGK34453.1 MAG: nucleotidyltransferase [Candidatus Roizmanbacteria bacterium RIFCSPHIGHO2_12_FULL_38_13]OGK48283.1 MAG: nucleotidyltransferase [Candidatus Roizmanbacteria bacterium RIFCSPLOWO2_01_FULL_38_12]
MQKINITKRIIAEIKPDLKSKFKVKTIGLFGSVARAEDDQHSDIDLLVEFFEPVSFFHFLDLEEYLKDKLKQDMDLVTKNALKPHIGKQILQEVTYL